MIILHMRSENSMITNMHIILNNNDQLEEVTTNHSSISSCCETESLISGAEYRREQQ